jgi:ribosome biogenesis GTPase / thiamine phosphate phosphatase
MTLALSSLGWNDFFAASFRQYSDHGFIPARVALEHKHAYVLLSGRGELTARCTGKLLHCASSRANLPAVGDWVATRIRPGETCADIHAVLPRQTKFSRAAVGGSGSEQIVGTNIDTVLLVTALDQNYNLRRIERYLTLAWESGAQPVVVLSKSDLHSDPTAAQSEVESIAIGAPVVAVSATSADGIAPLTPWLTPGRTIALLGSSGVGKSTLINRIVGEERQLTATISHAVGKGRHTTSQRELIVAASGLLIIDTPGMRELQLWDTSATTIDATFGDAAQIAARCRFSNCTHGEEPGCAVQAALGEGTLHLARWQSFQKLQREQAYAARKADPRLARELKSDWKKLNKAARQRLRFKHDG